MEDFERIYFVREYLQGFSATTAMFLKGYKGNKHFDIKNADEITSNDIVGFTYYSMHSYPLLKRLRNQFPKNKIIVGGIGCFSAYNRILQIADYVYLGEGYEFNHESIIDRNFNDGQVVNVQTDFDYGKIPFVKTSKKGAYYQIERGCPYRCEYCYIGWVNPYSKVDDDVFCKRLKYFDQKTKGLTVTLVGNEGIVKERNTAFLKTLKNNEYNTASITMRKFLNNPEVFLDQPILRFGVELPSEELRLLHLPKEKQLTKEQLCQALNSNLKGNQSIQFFYIYDYLGTTDKDYECIFDELKCKRPDLRLRLNFTTLEVQPYTPLHNRTADHCNQLLTSVSFSDSNAVKKIKMLPNTRTYPARNREAALGFYLYTYTNLDMKTKIDDNVLSLIDSNCKRMTKTDSTITLAKF